MDHKELAALVAATVAATLHTSQDPPSPPFRHLVREWLEFTERRPSWRREIERLLKNELSSLPPVPTRADVAQLLRSLHSPSAHNHCLAIISAVYRWSMSTDRCLTNPAMGFKRRILKARERVLSLEELEVVWKACDDGSHYSRIIRLLMLTGQRAAEIGRLAWSEVRTDAVHLSSDRTKNHRPHIIPLTKTALTCLPAPRKGKPYVFGRTRKAGFSGWSKAKSELDARLPELERWTPHDLRRSFVTHANELGLAPPHIIEATVNHVSGHKAGVAGVYNRASYLRERRELMEKWDKIVAKKSSGGLS
jgi:integrase